MAEFKKISTGIPQPKEGEVLRWDGTTDSFFVGDVSYEISSEACFSENTPGLVPLDQSCEDASTPTPKIVVVAINDTSGDVYFDMDNGQVYHTQLPTKLGPQTVWEEPKIYQKLWNESQDEMAEAVWGDDEVFNYEYVREGDPKKLASHVYAEILKSPPGLKDLKLDSYGNFTNTKTKNYIHALSFFASNGESQHQFAFESVTQALILSTLLSRSLRYSDTPEAKWAAAFPRLVQHTRTVLKSQPDLELAWQLVFATKAVSVSEKEQILDLALEVAVKLKNSKLAFEVYSRSKENETRAEHALQTAIDNIDLADENIFCETATKIYQASSDARFFDQTGAAEIKKKMLDTILTRVQSVGTYEFANTCYFQSQDIDDADFRKKLFDVSLSFARAENNSDGFYRLLAQCSDLEQAYSILTDYIGAYDSFLETDDEVALDALEVYRNNQGAELAAEVAQKYLDNTWYDSQSIVDFIAECKIPPAPKTRGLVVR